jgi:hypothetical protein
MGKPYIAAVAGLACLAAASAAAAAPTLQIRHAAVHVVVIPEARSNIEVTVLRTNKKLPIYISRLGDSVSIDGKLWWLWTNCRGEGEKLRLSVFGLGDFSAADLPQIVVKTPMDARVAADGVTVGSVGRSSSLTLHHGGCGSWTVANVEHELELRNSGSGRIDAGSSGSAEVVLSGSGELKVGPVKNALAARVSGSGVISAASAGAADLTISGSGDVKSGPVSSGLKAVISGSGNLDVARLDGRMQARVSGVGHIRVPEGSVTTMEARISGAGDVDFGGVAQSLDAAVSGAGDISAAEVTGTVTKHVSGSGQVRVGR